MNQHEAYARALGVAEAALICIEIEARHGRDKADFESIRAFADRTMAKIKELTDGAE